MPEGCAPQAGGVALAYTALLSPTPQYDDYRRPPERHGKCLPWLRSGGEERAFSSMRVLPAVEPAELTSTVPLPTPQGVFELLSAFSVRVSRGRMWLLSTLLM